MWIGGRYHHSAREERYRVRAMDKEARRERDINLADYPPYKFYVWQQNETLQKAIPEIIGSYAAYPYLGFLIGAGITYFCAKGMKIETSHGSAAFATAKEIDETGLGMYEDKPVTKEREFFGIKYKKKIRRVKKSGVVVGVNPYNKKLMLHDGVEHILLVAPTRSGKGVNTVRLVQ